MSRPAKPAALESERDRQDYPVLELLDRLEELLEDMDALGVTNRTEVERRIAELESQLEDVDVDDEDWE